MSSAGTIVGLAGCGNAADPNEADGAGGSPGDGASSGTDASRSGTDAGPNGEARYDEGTPTGDVVLTIFQLPDGFAHIEEELLVKSELSRDDAAYDRLDERGVVRQHSNQFLRASESGASVFVSSTVFVCESTPAARRLSDSRAQSFARNGGSRVPPERDHEIPTQVVTNETSEGEQVIAYLGRHGNAVLELLVTNVPDDLDPGDLYIQMVVSLDY